MHDLNLNTLLISQIKKQEFLYSFLSSKSGVSKTKLKFKFFLEHELNHLNNTFKETQNSPIFFKKKKRINLKYLEVLLNKNTDLDCVILEDLTSFEEKEEVLFKGLKKIAKKHNIVFVCFFELKRLENHESYCTLKPKMNDFTDQYPLKSNLKHIDNIVFSWRPEYYGIESFKKPKTSSESKGEIIVYRKEHSKRSFIVSFKGGNNMFKDLKDYNELNWVEKLKALNT